MANPAHIVGSAIHSISIFSPLNEDNLDSVSGRAQMNQNLQGYSFLGESDTSVGGLSTRAFSHFYTAVSLYECCVTSYLKQREKAAISKIFRIMSGIARVSV